MWLDIDPNKYEGTTRQRFIKILTETSSTDQAKILFGILEKFPLSYFEEMYDEDFLSKHEFRMKKELHKKINMWITLLKDEGTVDVTAIKCNSKLVKDILEQCDTLIANHKPSSGVDRAHTALHAYLKEVCSEGGIRIEENNPTIQNLWSKIKGQHSNFSVDVTEYYRPINQIVNAIAKILDNMNEVRNNQSFSHPNDVIIGEEEARLVINLSRVFLQYVDSKVYPEQPEDHSTKEEA